MTRLVWLCTAAGGQERKIKLFLTRHVRELMHAKASLSCESLASVLTQSDAGSEKSLLYNLRLARMIIDNLKLF